MNFFTTLHEYGSLEIFPIHKPNVSDKHLNSTKALTNISYIYFLSFIIKELPVTNSCFLLSLINILSFRSHKLHEYNSPQASRNANSYFQIKI